MQTASPLLKRWPYAVLLAAVALVWGQSVSFQFVWDDKFFIQDLQSIRSLTHAPDMFYSLGAQSSYPEGFVLFRPLRTLHYALLFALGGGGAPKPWLFHLANILWHAAAVIILYRVLVLALRRQFQHEEQQSAAFWIALIGALAFAVHPVVSEVVCWAKSLDDLMATTFVLASCYFLLAWKPGEPSLREYWGALICFALAVYSKESAVPFALFATVLLAWSTRHSIRQLTRLSAPFFAVAIVFVLHRHLVIGRTSQVAPLSGSYGQTLLDTLTAGPIYARLLAGIPPFCIDYTYMKSGHAITSPAVIAGAALLLMLIGLSALVMRRNTALLGAGFLWMLLFLLPVSNLIPTMQYCAERFLYLPMIGLLASAAAALLAMNFRRIAITVSAVVLTSWAVVGWSRSWIWKDAVTLFVQTHLEGNSSWRVQDNAVAAAFDLPHVRAAFVRVQMPGHPAQLMTRSPGEGGDVNWPAVERTLTQLHHLFSNDVAVITALGIANAQQGRLSDALPWFERATQRSPENIAFWNNLAQAYADAGRLPEAEASIRRALSLNSNSIPSLQRLADVEWRQEKWFAARATYERLGVLDPANVAYTQHVHEARAKLAINPQPQQ